MGSVEHMTGGSRVCWVVHGLQQLFDQQWAHRLRGKMRTEVAVPGLQRLEVGGQDSSLPVIELGEFGNTGSRGNDLQAAWPRRQDIADIFFTG